MSDYVRKSASGSCSHEVDFAPLLRAGETVVADAGWMVHHTRAEGEPLKIARQSVAGSGAEAVFEGGSAGDVYLVTAQVDTNQNRTLKHGFVLAVTPDTGDDNQGVT